MKIVVTQEDIDNGEAQNGKHCPIALAIKRLTNDPFHVVCDAVEIHGKQVWLPQDAKRFINAFDIGRPVAPIQFDLELFL